MIGLLDRPSVVTHVRLPRAKVFPGPCVFVVDGDDWGRATLGRALRHQGYEVVPCASARELLLYLGHDERDTLRSAAAIALVNSGTLGSAEALDVIQALQAARLDTRVVALTSFSEDEDVISLLRAGACDYLRLPVRPEDVHVVIERVLALPKVG